MYNQSIQWSGRKRTSHGGERRQAAAVRERTRLLQLAVCAALFAAVFIGKGVFPQRLAQLTGAEVMAHTRGPAPGGAAGGPVL